METTTQETQTAPEVHRCTRCRAALGSGWSISIDMGPVCRVKMGLEPLGKKDREVERCKMCRRPLGNPETRERGMGKTCAARHAVQPELAFA